MMFKIYLATAVRSVWRHKLNSVINITGLSISIACCIVVYVFVKHETTFDHFHSKTDRIYRVVYEDKTASGTEFSGTTPFALAKALRTDFPDLETVTQVYSGNHAVVEIAGKNNDRKLFDEDQLTYADAEFFKTFDFPLLAGNSKQLLTNPGEVIISKSLADSYFGSAVPGYVQHIGKTLVVNKKPYRISAVMDDMPRNSNVACHMLLPFSVFAGQNAKTAEDWRQNFSGSFTFITVPPEFSRDQFEEKLKFFKHKYLDAEFSARQVYHTQPLVNVHTDTDYGGTLYATPSVLITAFISMAVIILITSCINFINLATAQSLNRLKEVGVRKTLGSSKQQLIAGFLGETFYLTIIAALFAVTLARAFLESVNQYLAFVIEFDFHIDYTIFFFLLSLALIITFLAGYYPAKVTSSYNATEALRNQVSGGNSSLRRRFSLRKGLVVTQFLITQLLIICTIVVAAQVQYFYSKDPGYQKQGIQMIEMPSNDQQKISLFRNQVMALSGIRNISFNSGPPTSAANAFIDIRIPESSTNDNRGSERKFVDENYLQTFHIPLIAGRDLEAKDRVWLQDSLRAYNVVVNEKSVHELGFQSPAQALGQKFVINDQEVATIVGVTANFANASLQNDITPVVMFNCPTWVGTAAIDVSSTNAGTLQAIQKSWEALYPDHVFKAMTLNDYMERKAFYLPEDIIYKGFQIFVFLSIIIGCMGLYGLVAFLALQRRKEIGIRKALGSSVNQVIYLLSKDFIWLTGIAFLIAAPLAYLAMNAWLQTFANRTEIHLRYFVTAFFLSLVIAALTVGYQSVQAAMANPAKSLKVE